MSSTKILKYFVIWRLALFFILFISLSIVSLKFNFLGGGISEYLQAPYVWGWANFDGEKYLTIAQNGYKPLEYFFFPLFPLLTQYISIIFGETIWGLALSGLFISNIAFVLALLGIKKLVLLDYDRKYLFPLIFLLLLFPTAFYFGSFYTESLFLAEVVWAFYFARKGQWIYAGILGAMATSTRIVGVAMIPAFFMEACLLYGKEWSKYKNALLTIFLTCLGIGTYMLFLYQRTGDAFAFFTSLHEVFGDQRSNSLVLLPQVFYRYFFKIIPVIDYHYLPQVFTIYLELISGIIFFVLSLVAYFKLRLSYAVYLTVAYLLPTLSGSFSSFPRYALVLFPGFILLATYIQKCPLPVRLIIYILLGSSLFVAEVLYVRGYWVS